jgi:hypothetical protein
MVVRVTMTNLHRRLRKLEALLSDPSGLVPYSEKWLDYWQGWLDRWADDPSFRPREQMPLEAAARSSESPTTAKLEQCAN